MYLMTAHRKFIGTGADGSLLQLPCTEENVPKLVRIFDLEDGDVIDEGPLAGFNVERSPFGISFTGQGKYLCAPIDSVRLTADRDVRSLWETFTELSEGLLPGFIAGDGAGDVERFCREVARLRAAGKPVKIYCGAGEVPRPGFLNLDIDIHVPKFFASHANEYFIFPFADMSWGLPDDSVDYIFHEDFIEHIGQVNQYQFLTEALRVLKPGCWHRVNTPNIVASMKRHSNFKAGFSGVYTGEKAWGHVSMFSPASLKEVAELVGYREVVFTTRNHGVSPFAVDDFRPGADRDDVLGNIYADLLK
jgi:hypothetical protein